MNMYSFIHSNIGTFNSINKPQDKDGNVIDLGTSAKKASPAASSAPSPSTVPTKSGDGAAAATASTLAAAAAAADASSGAEKEGGGPKKEEAERKAAAGLSLLEAAKRSIAEGGAAAVRKKDEEDATRKAVEEKAHAEAEQKRLAEEKKKKEIEERSRAEAEERAKQEAARARKEIEERARAEAAERKAAEERRQEERKAAIEARKAGGGGGSLSSLANQLEAKEKEDAAKEKEADDIDNSSGAKTPPPPSSEVVSVPEENDVKPSEAPAPVAGAGTGTSTPSSTPLRPGGLRPGMGTPGGSLRPGGLRSGVATPSASTATAGEERATKKRRIVWSKAELLGFRDLDVCCRRPDGLPDQTIQRGPSGGGGGGRGNRGGGGGGGWQRGNAPPPGRGNQGGNRRQSAGKGDNEWSRGKAPPRPTPNQHGGRGRRGKNDPDPNFLDDGTPVVPLQHTQDRWVPVKSNSTMVLTEKKIKGILNKMTKEKFDKLSAQMCEVPILSYEILAMIIKRVYDKAIFEPTFGDMYSELCLRLSQTAKRADFVKIIESDEEPPTEDGTEGDGTSSSENLVYRWSNDVDTNDDEVVGPFDTPEECIDAALDPDNCPDPVKRGDQELVLHNVKIRRGTFIKTLRAKEGAEGDKYYAVFFSKDQAENIGQQMSDIFLSEREAINNGIKENSFRRSLLNKCEDEFDKQDIYVNWKEEMAEYQASKDSLTESERAEKEGDLEFRRMKIKKQMPGYVLPFFSGTAVSCKFVRCTLISYALTLSFCNHSLTAQQYPFHR